MEYIDSLEEGEFFAGVDARVEAGHERCDLAGSDEVGQRGHRGIRENCP